MHVVSKSVVWCGSIQNAMHNVLTSNLNASLYTQVPNNYSWPDHGAKLSLPHLRREPCSLNTSIVELSLPVLSLDTKTHCAQLAGVPARNKLALAAILPIN
jgi:hypothetical protein